VRAIANDYNVVVLDRDLPGMHGDDICAELVTVGRRSRVLMLTAAASMEDLVDGLGLGPTTISRSRSTSRCSLPASVRSPVVPSAPSHRCCEAVT
jgi:CheY-like chemotaxis protein